MIGGMDVRFDVRSGPTALDFTVRLVARWWPDCVFVADDDATVTTDFERLPFRDRSEVIIYRDAAAADAWDALGYDDSLKGTMVYLLSDEASLTLVTEHDPCPDIIALTAAIRRGLLSGFRRRSEREAA